MALIVPKAVAEKLREEEEDRKVVDAFQTLMHAAYFSGMDSERRKFRYAIIRALSDDMLGRKQDYEVLT